MQLALLFLGSFTGARLIWVVNRASWKINVKEVSPLALRLFTYLIIAVSTTGNSMDICSRSNGPTLCDVESHHRRFLHMAKRIKPDALNALEIFLFLFQMYT
jgi:hypothetical protein